MKGTTKGAAKHMMSKSTSSRHGPSVKNVANRGKSAGKPSGPTAPIKGMDKGGV